MQESDEQQPSSIILGSQGENDADQLIPSAIGLLLHISQSYLLVHGIPGSSGGDDAT